MLRTLVLAALIVSCAARAQVWPGERARIELVLERDGGWPPGSMVRAQLDHAALVAAGLSEPDGGDVTILVRINGGLAPRALTLNSASAWNQSATAVWFRVDRASSGAAEDDWSLSFGGAPTLLHDARAVFLFADDFEDGSLTRWRQVGGGTGQPRVELSDAGVHAGAFALMSVPRVAGGFQVELVSPTPFPADLVLDTWVWLDDPPDEQWAWFLRFDSLADDSFNFGPDSAGSS